MSSSNPPLFIYFVSSDLQIRAVWGKSRFLLLRFRKCKPGAEMKRGLSRFICCWQRFRGCVETDQAAFTSSGELQEPFRDKDGTQRRSLLCHGDRGIFCWHQTAGRVHGHGLLVCLGRKEQKPWARPRRPSLLFEAQRRDERLC